MGSSLRSPLIVGRPDSRERNRLRLVVERPIDDAGHIEQRGSFSRNGDAEAPRDHLHHGATLDIAAKDRWRRRPTPCETLNDEFIDLRPGAVVANEKGFARQIIPGYAIAVGKRMVGRRHGDEWFVPDAARVAIGEVGRTDDKGNVELIC